MLFQVIEHIALDKLDVFLREIKRVTRPDGQVIVSTPNRDIRLLPFQKPWNKFHTKEYSAQDLEQLLSRYFAEVKVEGLFGVEALNKIERRRVRQKPGKVYIKEPLRKYLIRPIRDSLKAALGGAFSRRAKTKADNASLPEANAAVTEPADYPFTTSDLEFRDDSLHEALDLRATVLRIE